MNQKRENRAKESLIGFKNAIRGSRRPRVAVREARGRLLPGTFAAAVSWLRTAPFDAPYVLKRPFRFDYRDLEFWPRNSELDLELELEWAAAVIGQFAHELQRFNSLTVEFSRAVLLGDSSLAFRNLDSIEESFGVSIWLIKNRLAAEQHFRGFEAQKRFLLEVNKSAETSGIVSFIAHYASVRNEVSISPGPFRALYRRHLEAQSNLPPAVTTYAAFHILGILPSLEDDCSTLLSVEGEGSLVDYFDCFKRVMSHYARQHRMILSETLTGALHACASSTRDPHLIGLSYSCSGDTALLTHLGSVPMFAFDEFLSGNYELAATTGLSHLDQDPNAIELLELTARARSVLSITPITPDSPRLVDAMAGAMQSVIAKDADSKKSLLQLEKLSLNFRSLPWAAALSGFCDNELRATPELEALHFKARGLLPSPYLHPFHAVTLSARIQTGYLEACKQRYQETLTTTVVAAFLSKDRQVATQFSLPQRFLLRAEWALMRADYDDALAAAEALFAEPVAYFQHKAVRLYAFCLIRLGRPENAIRYITTIYVNEPRLYLILPIVALASVITDQHRWDLRADPSLAIFYEIYSRHVDDRYDHLRQYAFEDLVLAADLSRPHELRTCVSTYDKLKLVFFLRFLCVPHIMDVSPVFDTSHELLEERLSVCQLLAEIDPNHIVDYQTEIKDITRRLVVQSGLHQIEQTKIYVDIASIRQFAVENMVESFNRYQAFGSLDHHHQSILLRVTDSVGKSAGAVLTIHLPTDERFEIVRALVLEIRDEFVSSSEHGLDGYLSVRIRHGTLSGQLRSALEAVRLLTQRDRRLGAYRPNDYWAKRVLAREEKVQDYVAQRLAIFSAAFDSMVNELLSQWIQVQKGDKTGGMFNFELFDTDIHHLALQVTSETSFDEFLDLTLRYLWERLSRNLESIRTRFNDEAKPRFDNLLQTLQADIESLEGDADVSDLVNSVASARTEMQRSLNRVIEWFRLPAQTNGVAFRLDLPVQIAVESVRRFYPRVVLEPEIDALDEIEFKAGQLASLVDIFFILFENIAKHSGSVSPPRVKVLARDANKAVTIAITNSIARHVKTEASATKVAEIQKVIDQGSYHAAVKSEGGTGLVKIHKILAHDFGRRALMVFGFKDEAQEFEVNVSLPKEAWM